MSMTVQEYEDDWAKNHPQTARVIAYLSADGKDWVIRCPYCLMHHRHGAAIAGLRNPHCAGGAGSNPGYYLIPDGQLSDRMENEIRRMDATRRERLTREAERVWLKANALSFSMTGRLHA